MREIWAVVWGATWGNNMAAVEWGAALSLLGWVGRHHIGRHLGKWLAAHLAEHLKDNAPK